MLTQIDVPVEIRPGGVTGDAMSTHLRNIDERSAYSKIPPTVGRTGPGSSHRDPRPLADPRRHCRKGGTLNVFVGAQRFTLR